MPRGRLKLKFFLIILKEFIFFVKRFFIFCLFIVSALSLRFSNSLIFSSLSIDFSVKLSGINSSFVRLLDIVRERLLESLLSWIDWGGRFMVKDFNNSLVVSRSSLSESHYSISSPKMLLLSVSYELRSRISNALIFEAVKDLGTLFLNLNSDIFVCFNY